MKQRDDIHFIGIDPGNSGCKVAELRDGRIVYRHIPNVTGRAITLDPPRGKDEEVLSVEVLTAFNYEDRQPTFIGELARQQLQEEAEQDRDRKKSDTDSINLIVPSVVSMLYDGRPIVLGIGATPTDIIDQKPLLISKLQRRHSVKFYFGSNAGRAVTADVIKVYPFAQCAAGIVGILHSNPQKEDEWSKKTILGCDFGHGQFSAAFFENLKPTVKYCFSEDFGFYKVVNAVGKYLSEKFYVTATIPQLQKYVEQGYYMKNNQKIDLNKVIDEACGALMKSAYDSLVSRIPQVNRDQINTIVNMGGGGEQMLPYVQAKFGMKPEIYKDSIFANALGLLCVATEKWAAENAEE